VSARVPEGPRLAVLVPDLQPAAAMLGAAQAAERAGFEEVWIPEDYFMGGGVATATAVLATTGLSVGLGVLPAAGRHPAVLALDLAALADLYPGRLWCGIGAGMPEELARLGLTARSPLGVVRDTVGALRALLAGETLTAAAANFVAEEVALAAPPAEPPPFCVGAGGPKMLALSAAVADGTVLSVLSGREYVAWARDRLREAGAGPGHRLVVYALCAIAEDPAAAREQLREIVAHAALPSPRNTLSEIQGFAEEAEELADLDFEQAVACIPDRWLEELVVAGTPTECAATIDALVAAGADTVTLCFPPGPEGAAMLARAGEELRRAVEVGR
jgi:alkanesulfonate monooxygenase SsuD/methylene tetrahydromethanopterin reductase-like flavin-dependent oxidoreductase (luciferase family)